MESGRTFRGILNFFVSLFAAIILILSALHPSDAHAAKGKNNKPGITITGISNPNGRFVGKGVSKVKSGASKAFTATPKKGYKAGILVDGYLVRFQTDAKIKRAIKTKNPDLKKLKFVLKKIKANTRVEAVFIPLGKPFAQSLGLSLVGLGATIKVTNQNPALFEGLAETNIGVKSVSWQNLSNGGQGAANGTKNFNASIPLVEGDNRIVFSLIAPDKSAFSTEVTVTYYPNLDFSSAFIASDDILFINEGKTVKFFISLKDPTDAVVSLVSVDANGIEDGIVAQPMLDNGVLPDEIGGDGVFSTQLSVTGSQQEFRRYRVKVVKPTGTYRSEVLTIWITQHLTSDDIKALIDLHTALDAQYQALKAQGATDQEAFEILLSTAQGTSGVGAAGIGPQGGIWWITEKGILGFFHPFQPGSRGGAERAAQQRSAEVTAQQPESQDPVRFELYSPSDSKWIGGQNGAMSAMAAAAEENRVKSKKAILISPFLNNPNAVGNNFGATDDYFVPWQTMVNRGSECTVKADTEALNNGTSVITRDTFKNLDPFGVIHICTHGDNYYNGLLSLWEDVWGPNDWVRGYLSIVIMYTGEILSPAADGSYDVSAYETDLLGKRIAIGGGWVAVLPGFFQTYLRQLPNSLVLLGACRTSYNASMANVFLAKGAGAVLGYTDYVSSTYAQNTLDKVYGDLLVDDKTVQEGFDNAVTAFGANDNDDDPAAFTLFGSSDLKLPDGDLENGGFEDGGLAPWERSGDGRVISQLGAAGPVEGNRMGIVSTGLGFTTQSGSIQQTACFGPNVESLSLSWNFFSEEFKEYCNSRYQDYFQVVLCEIPEGGGADICTTMFRTEIDALCGGVFPVGVGFDRGGVYSTGWRELNLPLGAFAGKKVRVRISAGDVGDSIYDSAILVDSIKVNSPEAP